MRPRRRMLTHSARLGVSLDTRGERSCILAGHGAVARRARHGDVLGAATMPMRNAESAAGAPRRVRDIAIVGMACVMPGAPDVETFWGNILDGVDSVTEVPESRWVHATHYDPDHDSSARDAGRDPMSVSKWGGFVPDVGFDALRWGIPPASLPPELDAFLPELTEDGLPGVLTSVIAGRVANRLDLGGKNLTVDSACASVLVALDIACNELTSGAS